MSRRTPSTLAGLGLAVLLGGVLVACATPAGSGDATTAPPEPDAATDSAEIEVDAAWLDEGRMIGIVTQGSSSCVPMASDVQVDGAVLDVVFVEPEESTPCTRDLVPRVTLVAVPEGTDAATGLTVSVTGEGYHGEAELAGLEGAATGVTEYEPSAGWTHAEGQFVILTWGSSSCVPVIEDIAATGPAEVTVTFETPAENQVCTMDMAPRATIAFVDGLEQPAGAEAVLTGSPEFLDVRVPILGAS